jgi:hypothetical protein
LRRPQTTVAEWAGRSLLSLAEASEEMAARAPVSVRPEQAVRMVSSVLSALG